MEDGDTLIDTLPAPSVVSQDGKLLVSQTNRPVVATEWHSSVSKTNLSGVSQKHTMNTPPARGDSESFSIVVEFDPLIMPTKADIVILCIKRLVREKSERMPNRIEAHLPFKTNK